MGFYAQQPFPICLRCLSMHLLSNTASPAHLLLDVAHVVAACRVGSNVRHNAHQLVLSRPIQQVGGLQGVSSSCCAAAAWAACRGWVEETTSMQTFVPAPLAVVAAIPECQVELCTSAHLPAALGGASAASTAASRSSPRLNSQSAARSTLPWHAASAPLACRERKGGLRVHARAGRGGVERACPTAEALHDSCGMHRPEQTPASHPSSTHSFNAQHSSPGAR